MNETPEPKQPKHLRPVLILTILTVLLYVSVLGMAFWTFSTGQTNKGVLCALKSEHERDIENSLEFLKENPEGIEGITPALIRQGIADDRLTLAAFNGLNCPDE